MRWHTDTVPKLRHATSVPITLRIGRVAHALAADAAEIDGRSLNNELLHLIELGLGVRAKQEIVRKAMTCDPKPPPIRMRVNPHDPYSPIARLPGQTYPGDPLVKRPAPPYTAALASNRPPAPSTSARAAPRVRSVAEEVRSADFIPPTPEELAELGDELDDVDEELADLEARHPGQGARAGDPDERDPGPNHRAHRGADRPRVGPLPVRDEPDERPAGDLPMKPTPDRSSVAAKPLPDPGLFQRPCPAHTRRPDDPFRCASPGCPGSHWAHGTAP